MNENTTKYIYKNCIFLSKKIYKINFQKGESNAFSFYCILWSVTGAHSWQERSWRKCHQDS